MHCGYIERVQILADFFAKLVYVLYGRIFSSIFAYQIYCISTVVSQIEEVKDNFLKVILSISDQYLKNDTTKIKALDNSWKHASNRSQILL